MRNTLDKVADKAHEEVLAHLRRIYYAKSRQEALALMKDFARTYRSLYPKAVACLLETSHQLTMYFLFPRQHWQSIKTTNPRESIFSTVCLVYQLLRTSERRLRKINSPHLVAKTLDAMKTQSRGTKARKAA